VTRGSEYLGTEYSVLIVEMMIAGLGVVAEIGVADLAGI
jgi:hypothetical protein